MSHICHLTFFVACNTLKAFIKTRFHLKKKLACTTENLLTDCIYTKHNVSI